MKIMNPLLLQFSLSFCYFISLRSKQSSAPCSQNFQYLTSRGFWWWQITIKSKGFCQRFLKQHNISETEFFSVLRWDDWKLSLRSSSETLRSFQNIRRRTQFRTPADLTFSLCSSLMGREQVSHPYRTTSKIIFLCILIVWPSLLGTCCPY